MSKVATYLQGHVAGMVSTRQDVRNKYAQTASLVRLTPELVVMPRSTNDIRKLTRFAWQLAEKGHRLGLSARGKGADPTGGSATSGVAIDTSQHMNHVFEYDPKQHLLRAQPGASLEAIQSALGLHRSRLALDVDQLGGTLGGTVGFGQKDNDAPRLWVERLEVVLDTGDVIQTGPISKREFNKRRGAQGREGDIYRGIDAILEDHADLIAKLQDSDTRDLSGYMGILDIESKNGSIDLTPLFVGSQGTLGIITEMIVRSEYAPSVRVYGAALFATAEAAHDALEDIEKLSPTSIEYIDGALLADAMTQGNNFAKLTGEMKPKELEDSVLLIVGFDLFRDRKRAGMLKKLDKRLARHDCAFITSDEADIETMRSLVEYVELPSLHADRSAPTIIPGFFVPHDRFEDFRNGLKKLEDSLHLPLPLYGDVMTGTYRVMPTLELHKVGDKQKLFKLLDGLTDLLGSYGGVLVAHGAEGRLLSRYARSTWDDQLIKLMDAIKTLFDPHGILNPGVKQATDLKELVGSLHSGD